MMKYLLITLLSMTLALTVNAQESAYDRAMAAYKKQDYAMASKAFKEAFQAAGFGLSSTQLYDGACIYALNGDSDQALTLLNYLAKERFYANIDHMAKDSDLDKLHALPAWTALMQAVAHNKETLPIRMRQQAKTALLKAKQLLTADQGKLWGEQLWTDSILVLATDNTIYSLLPLPGASSTDQILYTKTLANGVLSQTNTYQKYENGSYATVLTSYLTDSSATIIHELFHRIQFAHRQLNGNPINYLDEYQPREWLRLEYQALRNALQAARTQKEKTTVAQFVSDALRYRKLRQLLNTEALGAELEIETLEGLANYTGFALSTHPDKYQLAITEITSREKAPTYTRTFPYATGPAYGLLFDYLKIDWRQGLDKLYDFVKIYEANYLHKAISTAAALVKTANARNNFTAIHAEEIARKEAFEQKIKNYTRLFVTQPTLHVLLKDDHYSMSYDMNGTLVLKDKGIVYSSIKGTDKSGRNFGSFKAENDNVKQEWGVLGDLKGKGFTFPLPVKIDGNKITGTGFEITLNKGWTVKQKNEKGDLEIVEE